MTFATSGSVGCTATLCGLRSTGISATTARVLVSITVTRFESWFAAYARVPSLENSTQCGFGLTRMSVTSVSPAVSITDTVPESWFGT